MGKIKPFALVLNTQGMDQKSGTFYIQPSAAELIQNMHTDLTGAFSAENQGYTHLTAQLEAGAVIDSLGWFADGTKATHLVTAVNGKIKEIDPVSGAVIGANVATGLTAGNRVGFENFLGTLYAAEPSIDPIKWDGVSGSSAIGLFPLTNGSEVYDKPKLIRKFGNRMTYGNFNGTAKFPAHLVISDTLAPENCTLSTTNDTDGDVIEVSPGDGQDLAATKSLYIPALDRTNLICYKDRSIYAVTGTTPSTFDLHEVSQAVGALNQDCVIQFGADHVIMDRNTITALSTANQAGSIIPRDLGSLMVRNTLKGLNLAAKDKAWAIHLPWRREIWFGIPTGSNNFVDTVMIYWYPENPQTNPGIWTVRDGISPSYPLVYGTSNTFVTGDQAGYINQWFGASQYAGQGYAYIYRYPWFDFGSKSQVKQVKKMVCWFQNVSRQQINFTSEWRIGGNISRTQLLTVPVSNQAEFGSAVFGVDSFEGSSLTGFEVKVPGNGGQFRFTVSGVTNPDGPTFLGVTGLVEYGGLLQSYR